MTERELRRQRELRARRRKAQRRKVMIQRTILFLALIGILVGVLLIISRLGGKSSDQKEAGKVAAGGENALVAGTLDAGNGAGGEGAESGAAAAQPAAGSAGNAGTAAVTDVSPVFIKASAEVTPATPEEALSYAAFYALQYDYDKAISTIQKIDGYESNSSLTSAIQKYTNEKASCVPVDVTTIPHVFFHSLLNDDRGLQESIVGYDRAWRNDAAMTTANEFDHLIQQLYDAGYVLVSLDDMLIKTKKDDGTTAVAKNTSLLLPEGKRAFVMSEDDLSYYHTYGIGTQGYATRMVIDTDGRAKCEYTDPEGVTRVGDYDVIPKLDTYIRQHPEFAYHNARGTVAMTGYNGVFGYRTNDYYKDITNEKLDKDQVEWLQQHPDFDWDEDVANATKIADACKEEGWTFASHTYGHWNASNKSVEALKGDNERWMTVNHNILGDIDKIIFAFGGDIGTVGGYTADNEKFQYFKSQGYVIYCNVDGHAGWTEFGPDYMRTGRVALDGFTMYQYMTPSGGSHTTYEKSYQLLGLHDVDEFFNPYRITPIESE